MIRVCENVLIVNDMAAMISRLRRRLGSRGRVGFLTDMNIADKVLSQVHLIQRVAPEVRPVVIEPGETSKSVGKAEQLCRIWLEDGLDRESLVVNIGGGVVTDLGSFAASVFKRGISFINIPTSLLAMVDASVGGKTGVNIGEIKNQIGTFSFPDEVIIWPGFLKWLPERELKAGFAECVKHALLQGGSHLKLIARGLPSDRALLTSLIEASVMFKCSVVEADAKETGPRKILNFGHTAGHAFESASHSAGFDPWLHGEAVAAGMLVALRLSVEVAGLSPETASRWEGFILEHIKIPRPEGFSAEEVIDRIRYDKKSISQSPRFVLLKAPGEPLFDQEILPEKLFTAVESVISSIS